MGQCTATSKQAGLRCKKAALTGTTVCRSHGGAGAVVSRILNLKHGLYARAVPAGYEEEHAALRADPDKANIDRELDLARTVLLRLGSESRNKGVLTTEDAENLLTAMGRVTKFAQRRANIEAQANASPADLVAWVAKVARIEAFPGQR
jgi:hypothetical protein